MKRLALTYLTSMFIYIGYAQESSTFQRLERISNLNFEQWSYIGKMASLPDSLIKIKAIDYLKYLGTLKYDLNDTWIEELEKVTHKLPPSILWRYTINNTWIKKNDVDSLIKYVYSKQPARIPWPMISSTYPQKKTTIGIEAMHLINIYRNTDFYYPSLCSTYNFCQPKQQYKLADEFVKWWEENRDK